MSYGLRPHITVEDLSEYDNVHDTRDIIDAIAESRDDLGMLREDLESEQRLSGIVENYVRIESIQQQIDDMERLIEAWEEVIEEVGSEAASGVVLVRDEYFEEFAQEEAEGCGLIDRNVGWPMRHIDWAAAAEELRYDYTSITIRGEEYWYRSY